MKKAIVLTASLFAVLLSFGQVAQDKAKMERERQAIQKELSEIQSVYEKVKGQKKETIGQLTLLQRKMNLQGQYINNINKEIRIITDDIYLSNLEINRLKKQLDTLKTQYARSVVYAYKNRSNYDYLNFIFSASSFNDALKRVTYLKSYRSYRQQQVANILETQRLIEDRKDQLLGKKTQKNSALQNQTQQMRVLGDQKKEKDAVVSKLKSQEKDLAKQIATRKKRDAQLKGAIAAVIRREIELARKKAEEEARRRRDAELAEARRLAEEKRKRDADTKAASGAKTGTTTTKPTTEEPAVENPVTTAPGKTSGSYLTLNDKDVKLANDFAGSRGRLPWPVDNGNVCIPYGTYTVPGTKLTGDNPGITICTPSPGTTVKAVFDGEVSSVANMGDGMTVIIRHGKYFTIYSSLGSVSVSRGSTVRTGQTIGRAGTDDEGGSGGKVDFLLMVETRNVNPEPWLR
ncbi:peptidoglycan DD-metalloendopeptidase family protein [Chitinophagaceae bacterium LB-8]|uniref:Peptidoglycan DD-metalloendopeptidase family protein n=1 Tax=Paraflavisolibacter caeni TaxID=2982496 RepID=A0A9X3BGU9_9BACT|nr:peptidoglycan DD-metalloendopeptidase family protein [Paraflavisolibacter caeni]MCU7548407.1 peptidoglycan DD-metalloendopeptidase family protein [Paraflavisolibacter caeni]